MYDEYGLIVGKHEDPGDSCHRICMWYLGNIYNNFTFMYQEVQKALQGLQKAPGLFVRHPSPGWWSDTDRLSRDQSTPLVILLFELRNFTPLKHFLSRLLKRGGFFWNTKRNGATIENHGDFKWPGDRTNTSTYDYSWKLPDIAGPEFWGVVIRGYKLWFLWPLLWISDLETLFSAFRHRSIEHTDVLNHVIISQYSARNMPTPISWLASKVDNPARLSRKLKDYFNRVGFSPMYTLWSVLL